MENDRDFLRELEHAIRFPLPHTVENYETFRNHLLGILKVCREKEKAREFRK